MKKQLLSVLVLVSSHALFAQTAKLQVIHNASDPIADTVDVYVGSTRIKDNFAFRTATSFLEVPGNTDLRIGIALANSTSVADTVPGLGTTVNLPAGGTYVAVANGVTPFGTFQANPSGKSISFGLYPYLEAKDSTINKSEVSFVIFHGSTDAPAVDVIANGAVTLASAISYGEYSGSAYTTVPAAQYNVAIHPAGSPTPVVKYNVDLSKLGGGAAVVLASGFLSPAGDPAGGKSFALIAAFANGTVVTFPTVPLTTGLFESGFQSIPNLMYPNPASTEVSINTENLSQLEIIDSKGVTVKTLSGTIPSSLNIENLESGLYVVKAVKNATTYTSKLSIQ